MIVRQAFRGLIALLMTGLLLFAVGCGHTDEEMAAKQREIDKLAADLKAARAQIAQDESKYNDQQQQLDSLRQQLKEAGVSEGKSREEAARLQQALAEYKQRADQLAAIEARFRELKSRLEKLTQVGLKVVVRNNRMVIQLPGDVLFDSGKDELKPGGKDVLVQVAEVVRNDSDLSKRNFQVAGHTDNEKYGGGLDEKHWAAAGYGDTDPLAGTVESQTKDDRAKNRRVELVLQPNVEEMLNLNNIK